MTALLSMCIFAGLGLLLIVGALLATPERDGLSDAVDEAREAAESAKAAAKWRQA